MLYFIYSTSTPTPGPVLQHVQNVTDLIFDVSYAVVDDVGSDVGSRITC